MRLIDADKLKDKFNSRQMYTGAIIKELIDMQSTSYYPKYVIEQLEELRDKANLNVIKNMNEPIPYSSASNRAYAYDMAIEVVKRGELDE